MTHLTTREHLAELIHEGGWEFAANGREEWRWCKATTREQKVAYAKADYVLARLSTPAEWRAGLAEDEAVVERIRGYLRSYTLPANVAAYFHPDDTHDTVAERCAPMIAAALSPAQSERAEVEG